MKQSVDQHHVERIEYALASNEAAKNFVAASWQRCNKLHELTPGHGKPPERLSARELQQACEALGPLLSIANPGLDRLYLAVGNVGCSILLADSNGIPVARRGAVSDDDIFNEWGIWPGADWSEKSEGTNGIGTCIAEERVLTIHKDQHFHSKNIGLSCTAAPIFDPSGKLMAVLDVSSCRADLTVDFVKLISLAVVDTARRIESQWFRHHFTKSRIILAPQKIDPEAYLENMSPGQVNAALLAVDQDDLIIGATRGARKLCGLTDADFMRPLPLTSLNGQLVDEAQEYITAERRIIQQALARSNNNVSAAARSMGISRATLHRKINKFRSQN